jgi:hypothetical protein
MSDRIDAAGPGDGAANEPEGGAHARPWRRNLTLAVFGSAAAYFLLTEHYAHTVQALPWLLLLACPAMHLFMHGGHRSDSR